MSSTTIYGVYRVMKSGALRYVSRTATTSHKLAEEIAKDLCNGVVTMPDGRVTPLSQGPRHHVVRPIAPEAKQ